MLRAIADGTMSLSHSALNAAPKALAADFLRSLLVKAGALPKVQTESNRLERWLETFLEARPKSQQHTLQMYAQ